MAQYSDGLLAGRPRFDSREGKRVFSTPQLQTVSDSRLSCYPVGITCSFPAVKRLWLEPHHSSPSTADVKNAGDVPQSLIYLHGQFSSSVS
jgi:hypothetical protein